MCVSRIKHTPTKLADSSKKSPSTPPGPFQQTNLFQQHLPYWSLLQTQICEHFQVLKRSLSQAIQCEASHTTQRLFSEILQYIRRYRRHFTKQDHISLITLCYRVSCHDALPGYSLYSCLGVLYDLLSAHKLISTSELTLEWRPLYRLYLRVKKESFLMRQQAYWDLLDPIVQLIATSSFYFPPGATQEILQELYPQLHPSLASNTYTHILALLTAFLPVNGRKEDTWGLWFEDVIKLWLNSGPILSKGDGKILKLLSRLAPHTVGQLDWAPYLHEIFDQLLKSVNIPVGPEKVRSRTLLPPKLFSKIIVYSIRPGVETLSHLCQLMKALETFFHPSNDGRHLKHLLSLVTSLVSDFMRRLAVETGSKTVTPSLRIPPEFRLREEDVDTFVTSLLPSLRLALFTKEERNQFQVATALGSLSTLRPRLFVPEVIEEAKEALVSVTEPHRLTSLLACLYSVSVCLTTGMPDFAEGRSYVIPLLLAILPGLDVNDAFKTALSLKVITQLVSGVPLVDCSQSPRGTEEIAGQTRLLEDFLLEFISKMFHFLECATTFMTLGELEGMQTSPHIHIVDVGMSLQSSIVLLFPFSLSVVLSSCPRTLFQTAVTKIFKLTTDMCGSIDKPGTSPYPVIISHVTTCKHGELAARLFFTHCLQCVRRVSSELQLDREERGDPEVKWNLELLSAVLQYGGGHALSHLQEVRDVLTLTRYARCKEIYQMSAGLLYDVITCLCGTYLTPKHHMGLDLDKPQGEMDYLSTWGTYFSKKDIRADWHLPSEEEVRGAETLLTDFLLPELDKMRHFVSGDLVLNKDEIQNSLTLIDSAIHAGALRFEDSTSPTLPQYAQLLTPDLSYLTIRSITCNKPTLRFHSLRMDEICPLMHSLALKLFQERQHETESMDAMVSILHSLLWPPPNPSGWSHVRIFEKVKHLLTVRINHKSRYSQSYLLHRLEAAHDSVGWEDHPYLLTSPLEDLFGDLLDLATSEYAATRQFAQLQLDHCFSRYLLSRRILFPRILALLGPDTPRERLKGVLHTMLFNKNMLLEYVCRNPDLLSQLTPALLAAPHTDKQPVIDLLGSVFSGIRQYVGLSDPQPPKFSPETRAVALECLGEEVSSDTLKHALVVREKEQSTDVSAYLKFVSDLISFVQRPTSSLFFEFSLSILSAVPHPALPRPPEMVPALLPILTHDTASVRYTAIRMLERIIKFKRPPFKKVNLYDVTRHISQLQLTESRLQFGEREDNKWLCVLETDLERDRALTQVEWDQLTFVDRSVGYTRPWPRELEVFAPAKDQRVPGEDQDREDQLITSWFSEEGNVTSLVSFLSQEERKNAEEFRLSVEDLFKGLSKSYGPQPLSLFTRRLPGLMTSQLETEQRLGLEMASGMLLGANHWQWREVSELESVVTPAFFQGVRLISKETSPNWATFVSRLLFKRDPRRFLWLWRGLLSDLFDTSNSCFTSAMRLLLLDCAVFYGSWRIPGVKTNLLSLLTPHLASPFQMLRSRIARLLVTVFSEEGPLADNLRSPLRQTFLSQLDTFPSGGPIPKLSSLPPVERDQLVCGVKVLAEFLSRTAKLVRFSPELLLLGETVLAQRNAVEEDELNGLLDSLAHSLSLLQVPGQAVPTLLTVFEHTQREDNWQLKLGKLYLFQVLVFSNLFTVLSHGKLVGPAVRSVLTCLLSDERIEVRDQAAESMSGLVRCGFYREDEVSSLVAEFSSQLGSPPQGRRARGHLDTSLLLKKHAGLLGLGSVVLAFPYSIPPFLPNIVMLVGAFLQSPPPLQATAKHVLSEFKRTHWDQWEVHRMAFSDSQLTDLRGMLVSPTYYV